MEAFSTNGYGVISAATANDGIVLAKEKKPSLIILDIMLPGGKNGFDALESLVGDSDTAKIPVLVLTNLDSEKDVALQIGAKDYLVKANSSIEQVVEKVKQLVK